MPNCSELSQQEVEVGRSAATMLSVSSSILHAGTSLASIPHTRGRWRNLRGQALVNSMTASLVHGIRGPGVTMK